MVTDKHMGVELITVVQIVINDIVVHSILHVIMICGFTCTYTYRGIGFNMY